MLCEIAQSVDQRSMKNNRAPRKDNTEHKGQKSRANNSPSICYLDGEAD